MVRFCCFGSDPEPVHIYGHLISSPCRSLYAFVKLTGVPHEFHVIDLNAKENLTEAYSKINPFQEVPAITHGSFNAWESTALIHYIAEEFNVNSHWYPKDNKIRARINAYLHWHHVNTKAPLLAYLSAKFYGPKFYGAPELSHEAEIPLKKKVDGFFEDLVWLIKETGYVARTREPSIADIFAYSEVANMKLVGFNFSQYPTVKTWFDKIGSNQAVIQVHEVLNGLLTSSGN